MFEQVCGKNSQSINILFIRFKHINDKLFFSSIYIPSYRVEENIFNLGSIPIPKLFQCFNMVVYHILCKYKSVVYNIMCKYKPPVNNDMIIK